MSEISVLTTISKDEAIAGMREWKKQISLKGKPTHILQYFKSNTMFELTLDEVNHLRQYFPVFKEESTSESEPKIHMYAGLEDNEFCFYLIDSNSDRKGSFDDRILKKKLKLEVLSDHSILPSEAQERIKRWSTDEEKNNWCIQNLDNMFQLIEINYSDYAELVDKDAELKEVKNFLAIKQEGEKPEIEIIAVNGTEDKIIDAQDFSIPRPPFTNISDYQLYNSIIN